MGLVITLLAVGALLLLLETVLPGMVAGILGFLFLVGGVVMGYFEFGANTGTLLLIGVMALLLAGFGGWLWLFPKTPMGRAFISGGTVGELKVEQTNLVGRVGVAFTRLRPSGTALIQGQRVDVVTEGSLVEKGTAIQVIAVEGMKVVVRPTASGGDES